MAASLAHEIRNPLNLINLTAGHLEGSFSPADPEKYAQFQEFMKALQGEVQHLNQVVHHFLSASRPGRMRQEFFALQDLVEEARILMKPQFSAKGITLENKVEKTVVLQADKEQIRLLLLNLFLNAIEAVPGGGKVEIDSLNESGDAGREWMTLRVMDSGPGIQPDDLDHVFDAYFTRKESGVGLGLALVRRIAEEHGGSVRVSNRPEGGACFEVRIPGGV